MGRANKTGEEYYNNKGCLMRIVEDNGYFDITVEFQDEYKAKVHTSYNHILSGEVKNPYYHSVYGVGITGNKYPTKIDGKRTKECVAWYAMIRRCFDEKIKDKNPTYKDVTCCDEWLLYDNFYEWLHSQENFNKWYDNDGWNVDKDILVKGNKIYSPETCCLVPHNVNTLFVKNNKDRGGCPIRVYFYKKSNKFRAQISNKNQLNGLGYYLTLEDAFYLGYKPYKENLIKQVAQEEYAKGNITKHCYDAMMNYEVEITD